MKLFVIIFFVIKSIAVYACEIEDFNYSISLMWVNKEKDETQEYIAPQKYLDNAKDWHKSIGEKDAVIFWYDGQSVTKKALSSTENYLQDCPRLRLRNLRDLETIKKNEDIFRSPIPLYFRVDLLRVIATLNLAKEKEFKYILYADQDVPVKTKEYLFYKDETYYSDTYYRESLTLNSLEKFGLTCCQKSDCGRTDLPENSFFILDRDNPDMLFSQAIGLVGINILRAKKALEKGGFGSGAQSGIKNPLSEDEKYVDMQQLVWASFPGMIKLYYLKSGQGTVTDQSFQPDPDFDREIFFDRKNSYWVDLFDIEEGKFKRYTELKILIKYYGGEGEKLEMKQFAPEESKDLLSGIHQKRVGQPKSQFVK